MASFPDLAACEVRFMQFRLHLSGGMETLDSFWEVHGLPREKERLVFGEYTRRKKVHSIYLQWSRIHDTCADMILGVESLSTKKLFPRRGSEHRLLDQETFHEFLSAVKPEDIPWGARVRYAYPSKRSLGWLRSDKSVRLRSMSFDVLDEEGRTVLFVEHSLAGKEWLTIIQPAGRMSIDQGVGAESFFDTPYKTACALAESLRRPKE